MRCMHDNCVFEARTIGEIHQHHAEHCGTCGSFFRDAHGRCKVCLAAQAGAATGTLDYSSVNTPARRAS